MKKLIALTTLTLFAATVIPATSVFASEEITTATVSESQVTEIVPSDDPTVTIEKTADGGITVTKQESLRRAAVYRWGGLEYTNIAVTTGVAANAINAAFWAGGKASTAMFGIPGWAIGGLLMGAQWTQKGSSPGNAVAKAWDKNGNGWIGFYYQRGYDAAGRVVATRYSTL
ncbi:hypothetical protein [Enterococcus faecalis]|uniref:hypothetical protein n=1 Tax=Enterococcus faecalis TaxID=1351 RepID=UPI00098D62B5|nr:hypothetical protein [Enterococcus faecalis]